MKKTKLMLGDNIESLKKLPDNSIDSVVSDPPYGLSAPKNSGKSSQGGFMGKKWDYDVPSVDFWKEVYRVLKPGGHILSFGGTRTYHRMVVNIEDAGFEIRDQIMWLYGSGFPKSHNIGKSVDKLQGNEREVVGEVKQPRMNGDYGKGNHNEREIKELELTKGSSPYEGWGTALKPANEPICVARKPLSENTIAENVLKWGTGGINIDGCRVGSEGGTMKVDINKDSDTMFDGGRHNSGKVAELNEGRFPANIILECICDEVIKGEKGEIKEVKGKVDNNGEIYGGGKGKNSSDYISKCIVGDKGDTHTNPMCPCRLLDEQSGVLSNQSKSKRKGGFKTEYVGGENVNKYETLAYTDKGGASRYFYQAKVSKQERNMGLDGFDEKESVMPGINTFDNDGNRLRVDGSIIPPLVSKNVHPTVKPVALMSYLCRLVTPANGIVCDPFMGSGSTGIASQLEGFRFVGMEMDPDYFKIAEARIDSYEQYKKFIK
jgi:site-specific DNA-methyltransferase (adenine-specific)